MEEENQIRMLELLTKLQRQSHIGTILVESAEAEITLFYLRTLVQKNIIKPPSLEESLRIAIDLEWKLKAFTIENFLDFADQSHRQLFIAISDIGVKRLASLQAAYYRAAGVKIVKDSVDFHDNLIEPEMPGCCT